MDDTVAFKVGDLVRFKTEKASKEWPNFTFDKVYEVYDLHNDKTPRLWDDKHNHGWWILPENLELVTPESAIDIWATP